MKKILNSTQNTRAILPDSMKFIRSDVPDRITEEEINQLIAHNITTIIDLREENERIRRSCPLMEHDDFNYICMPVTGGNTIPPSVDMVSKSYINMVDEQMHKIIDLIMSASSNVLYFCNAGKDRTGVVSAILLQRLGMNRQYIIDDYMKSLENLKEMLDTYAKQFPDVNIAVITPQKRYMEEFLEWLQK